MSARILRALPLFYLTLMGTAFPFAARSSASSPNTTPSRVDFGREVLPLLKAHCFQCHGGGESQGGLRLDSRALALKGGKSGTALVPGNGAGSLMLARILGKGGKPAMPLGFAPLANAQIALLRAWIDQGVVWPEGNSAKRHWAYLPPVRPKVPQVHNRAWVRNPIDVFVLARLEREGLKPSPEADKTTLIRRVTLDLTGLPPTPGEVAAFLADKRSNAYARVVDRLLASPHYGERMALPWLDTARYADSNGFQQDGDTFQYVWRDWVVRSLNANLPFDQFTIQQLAGDLLPNATLDQKVATGFNRCHLLNGEGGAIPEEQRNIILFDRVDVTATTWMGATLACAQCHNHKYDPFTQKDYYAFLAFFNQVPESGVPAGSGQYRIAEPAVVVGSDADNAKLKEFEASIAAAKTAADRYVVQHASEIANAQTAWEAALLKGNGPAPTLTPWSYVGPFPAESFDAAYEKAFAPEQQIDLTASYLDGKLKWEAHPEWADGKPYPLTGENAAFYIYRVLHAETATTLKLSFGSDDAIKVWLNGTQIVADKAMRGVLPDQDVVTVTLKPGDNRLLVKIINGGGVGGFYFKPLGNGLPADLFTVVKTRPEERSAEAAKRLYDYFLENSSPEGLKGLREQVQTLTKQRDTLQMSLPRVMVMSDAQPRKTHILNRGNYETPGAEVSADTPGFLPPIPAGAPRNRLGLAKWLIRPENPLTARVQVNRYWQLFFGTGLVKTSENFGTQSEPPTHPELLDWLAVEFRESGWNVKRMHRLIVTSATYRQSSKVTPALRQRDPENKLLARGARFRLSSLFLRDIALATSGLLDARIGGKPVYPYQPKGIWDGLAITNERDFTYPQSTGADLYRRSLYTFWRRTVAPANMFDASVRNTCKVRLATTSTPLHALTMLNDVTWVEAGRALAQHVMKEAGSDPNARLAEAFRRVCARRPRPEELTILRRCLERALAEYRASPSAATAYLKQGDSPRDTALDPVQHAAYATVCLAIYNLDEALTRE